MFLPFTILLLLKSVTSLFQSRLLDGQTVLLELKTETFAKQDTQLNNLLSDPHFLFILSKQVLQEAVGTIPNTATFL